MAWCWANCQRKQANFCLYLDAKRHQGNLRKSSKLWSSNLGRRRKEICNTKSSVQNIAWGLACNIEKVEAGGHAASKTSVEGSSNLRMNVGKKGESSSSKTNFHDE